MIKTRKLIRIINIILLVSIILRFCFVIIHINHDCTHDDNCPVCTLIHIFKKDLTLYKPNSIVLLTNLLFFCVLKILYNNLIKYKTFNTLVDLKVELLN